MTTYNLLIVFTNGRDVTRTIHMKPRQLRRVLRQGRKGKNMLFRSNQERYLVRADPVSRILVTPAEE